MTKDKHSEEKQIKEEKQKHPEESVDYKDKWMRSLAEYENLKKRFEREKQDTIKFSNQLLIIELFPIMDSFDSAIKSAGTSDNKESFLKGLKMLQAEFHRVLENSGLKKIKTVGEKFNPHLHEAEEEVFSEIYGEGLVVEEIRGGYTLNDGLLRPALVKVSKGKEQKTEKGKSEV